MSMDLYSTGIPFTNPVRDPKYINFNSEVVVRKGNEGWIINSKVDNYTNDAQTYFDYILTTYKYEDNQWKEVSKKWWKDSGPESGGHPALYEIMNDKNQVVYSANIYNQLLVIKVPKENPWWNSKEWMTHTGISKIAEKRKTETKQWSGVWVDDSVNGEDSWIFEDIELYISEKKYSQIFCKEEKPRCFETWTSTDKLRKSNELGSNSWKSILEKNSDRDQEKVSDILKDTVKPLINKLKDSRGTWMKLEDICDSEVGETPSEERKQQLRMYCSNGKKN